MAEGAGASSATRMRSASCASTAAGWASGTARRQSLLSEQGWPNFLPTALGGGDNGVVHGDFGYSIQPAGRWRTSSSERMPATLILMLTAFVIWVTIAIVHRASSRP